MSLTFFVRSFYICSYFVYQVFNLTLVRRPTLFISFFTYNIQIKNILFIFSFMHLIASIWKMCLKLSRNNTSFSTTIKFHSLDKFSMCSVIFRFSRDIVSSILQKRIKILSSSIYILEQKRRNDNNKIMKHICTIRSTVIYNEKHNSCSIMSSFGTNNVDSRRY